MTRGDGRADLGRSLPPWNRRHHGQSVAGHPAAAPGREAGRQGGGRGPQAKELEAEAGQSSSPAETERYRLQREKEFKAKEAAALGSHGSCSTEVEDPQEKMTILQTYFRQNRDEVLDNLLAFVCDIQPEIHKNYHKNG
ncbi:hypothetical protein J1605_021251 [Eschrichtius robustus]|uniref:V-type proton ATPase subunit G n=1 Tax=Eschrichtius robustus TaxID=9764 RepID=A0AB34HEI6_ESCRO|nr:hypothetical protein J1605_021251 [Eschrichtius robustus]